MATLGVSEAGLVRVDGDEFPGDQLMVFTPDEYATISIAHKDPAVEDPVEVLDLTAFGDIINEETELVFGSAEELQAFILENFVAPPPVVEIPVVDQVRIRDSITSLLYDLHIVEGVLEVVPVEV